MFKTILYSVFLLLGIAIQAQSTKGINFQKLNLEEAKNLAKKENKLIFIDVYTTWCGPCKLMKKNTFTDDKVGELFNKNFISLAVDAEKEGIDLAKEFKIVNYPSFLFLDKEGKLVQYDFGYYNATQFLQIGSSILQKRMSQNDSKSIDQVKGKMVGEKVENFTAKDQLGKSFSSSAQKQKIIFGFHSRTMVPLLQQIRKRTSGHFS